KYAARWPESPDSKREQFYTPRENSRVIVDLSKTEEVWYLQPSFGYYFEYFYAQPHGLIFQMERYGTNYLLPPRLDTQLVDANEKFWAGVVRDDLPPLLSTLKFNTPQIPPTARQKLFAKFRLPLDPNFTANYIANCYSRSLNSWGTELQALNLLDQAGKF